MSTSSAEERQREIVRVARRTGSVDVTALAAELGVAKETVRRDLRALEDHGLVRRTHGGAYPVESAGLRDDARLPRHQPCPREAPDRPRGGRAARGRRDRLRRRGLHPQLIAEALPRDRPLTVVTASLPVAGVLAESENTSVLLLGGRVRHGTLATVDHWTTKMLAGFVLDLAFIGANGISREHGLTTPDPAVSEVKAQAIRAARRTVFAGVHTKFGAVSFCRFADIGALETIVTSTLLPSAEAHRYSLLGPQVIRV